MEKMELLEEKIRRAADTIRSLREEVRTLSSKREDPEKDHRIEKLTRERQMVAERIDHMLNIINEVEAS